MLATYTHTKLFQAPPQFLIKFQYFCSCPVQTYNATKFKCHLQIFPIYITPTYNQQWSQSYHGPARSVHIHPRCDGLEREEATSSSAPPTLGTAVVSNIHKANTPLQFQRGNNAQLHTTQHRGHPVLVHRN